MGMSYMKTIPRADDVQGKTQRWSSMTMIILNEITGWKFIFFLFIFDKDYYGLQHETP